MRFYIYLCFLLCLEALAEKVVLGYRVMNQAEAKSIQRTGRFFRPAIFDRHDEFQIGKGLYMSAGKDGFVKEFDSLWVAVAYIESDVLDKLDKIWIPRSLHDKKNVMIEDYIKDTKGIDQKPLDPAKTLQISTLDDTNRLQLVVPSRMINDGTVGITASAARTFAELPYQDHVDFMSWKKLIFKTEENRPSSPLRKSPSPQRRKSSSSKGSPRRLARRLASTVQV